jgi:hypothetical protein
VPAPTVDEVTAYLADQGGDWTTEQIGGAYAAEKAAQASVCTVPADVDPWPADLAEALCRRVAHNLALRALPLGVAPSITDGAVAIARPGGTDAEVRRLEAPYRKRTVVG